MAAVGIAGIALSIYLGFKGNEKTDLVNKRVDEMGVPIVTNSRGELMALPDSTRIKFFPNDSIIYILHKMKTK
jgi:hypothetical protein